jgi:glycosyltransferase involved in cell wall biosynthesis
MREMHRGARPRTDLTLVFAGSGPDEPGLRRAAVKQQLGDRVRFLGWVSAAEKAFLLRHALFTLAPATEPEAFGLVVLESAAAGKPVIASDLPALNELVIHGQTGLLVKPESLDDLKVAIATLANDRPRAAAMGAAAATWAEPYNWPQIALKHMNLYRELVAAHKEPR